MMAHAYYPSTRQFQDSLGNKVSQALSQNKTEKGQNMGTLGY